MSSDPLSEFDFIDRHLKALATHEFALGLTDDAAVIRPDGRSDLIISKDMLVAGVHFFPDDPPFEIAQKALRVNLSDLAAKGARPLGYFLGLGIPASLGPDWLKSFCEGLKSDQETFGISLLGGDTVRAPERLTISVTILGSGTPGAVPLRGGAKPGDAILITGTLGDGALGLLVSLKDERLKALNGDQRAFLRNRYLIPRPRLEASDLLKKHATSSIDISDGLLADLGHILKASGSGGTIVFEDIPLSDAARAAVSADGGLTETVLSGGDDYEILFTASRENVADVLRIGRDVSLPITEIGVINEGSGLSILKDGTDLRISSRSGHDHFRS